MTKAESAAKNMSAGKVNCAQAVLTAFCDEIGIDEDTALRVAQGFGGGIARTGQTCGAVTGAIMVIGLLQEKADPSNENKERIYRQVKDFLEKFQAKHGSTTCKGLLGYDISQPEDAAIIKEKGFHSNLCPTFVKSAVEMVDEMPQYNVS